MNTALTAEHIQTSVHMQAELAQARDERAAAEVSI